MSKRVRKRRWREDKIGWIDRYSPRFVEEDVLSCIHLLKLYFCNSEIHTSQNCKWVKLVTVAVDITLMSKSKTNDFM